MTRLLAHQGIPGGGTIGGARPGYYSQIAYSRLAYSGLAYSGILFGWPSVTGYGAIRGSGG